MFSPYPYVAVPFSQPPSVNQKKPIERGRVAAGGCVNSRNSRTRSHLNYWQSLRHQDCNTVIADGIDMP